MGAGRDFAEGLWGAVGGWVREVGGWEGGRGWEAEGGEEVMAAFLCSQASFLSSHFCHEEESEERRGKQCNFR